MHSIAQAKWVKVHRLHTSLDDIAHSAVGAEMVSLLKA